MIEAAQQAGLVALDDSSGWLWLPPSPQHPQGMVLPEGNADRWARYVEEVRLSPKSITQAEAVKALLDQVRPLLEPEGWTIEHLPKTLSCRRYVASAGLWQEISLSSRTVAGDEAMFGIDAWGPSILCLHQAFDEAIDMLRAQYPGQ